MKPLRDCLSELSKRELYAHCMTLFRHYVEDFNCEGFEQILDKDALIDLIICLGNNINKDDLRIYFGLK